MERPLQQRTVSCTSFAITVLALTCATPTNCLAFFSGCIGPRITRVPAWVWLLFSASFIATVGLFGLRPSLIKAQRSILLLKGNQVMSEANAVEILLVEDNPGDMELTLRALR